MLGFGRVEPPGTLAERATWVERAGMQIHLMRRDVRDPAGNRVELMSAPPPTSL